MDPLKRFDIIDTVVQTPLLTLAGALRATAGTVDRVAAIAHRVNVDLTRSQMTQGDSATV